MTSNSWYSFLTLFVIVIVMTAVAAQDYTLEDNVKELLSRRKNLDFMRQLVEDMDNQLGRLQKRTCYYNAGMSHNCDYKELSKNMNDETVWHDGPGKRKRSADASAKDGMRTLLRSIKALAINRKLR